MDKDHLRVVSIQTDDEIKHEHAASHVNWALRELAANLLRLLAGGGKEWMLAEQMVKSLNAMSAYAETSKATGKIEYVAFPTWWHKTMNGTEEDLRRWEANGEMEREDAQDDVCQAAMRIVASRLVHQRPQEATAEHLFFQGIRDIEAARQKLTRYYSKHR